MILVSVNLRSALSVVLALVILVALLGALFVGAPILLAQRTSTFTYEATVSTNETLTNVTLYLPAAAGPDGVLSDGAVLRSEDGEDVPADVRVVETDDGPMLAVSVDSLPGSKTYVLQTFDADGRLVDQREITEDEIPANMTDRRLVVQPTVYRLFVWGEQRDPIDTRTPVGDTYTLSPRVDETNASCEAPYADEEETCTTYGSLVYAVYDTGETNVVHVRVELAGWNEWGWGLSNSYNTYTDRVVALALVGPQSDWSGADGELHAGDGRYPTRGRPLR